MFEDHNDTVYEVISSANLLDQALLNELNDSHLSTGKSLADAIVDSGTVERSIILSSIADYLGYDYLETVPSSIPEDVYSSMKANVNLVDL